MVWRAAAIAGGAVLAEKISPTGWCVKLGMRFTTHHDAPAAFPNSMRVLDGYVPRCPRSGDKRFHLGRAAGLDVLTAHCSL